MKEDVAPEFEFTTEQENHFLPFQRLVDAGGFFQYGKYAGEHIQNVPSIHLAASVAYKVAEAIVLQQELNNRDCHDLLLVLLEEPEHEAVLSEFVNEK